MDEAEVIINGQKLTSAQSMALRVAATMFDAECGDDERGQAMKRAYLDRIREVLRIMISVEGS